MSNSVTRSSTFQRVLLILLFSVAVLNYFDRQSLSVVAPLFQRDLHLSDVGYGHVVTSFMFASAIAYALTGALSDKLGTARSMALFVGVWSLAEGLTSFAHSLLALMLARFLLGLGEPGLWVAAPKAVSEFFPRERHSMAIGLYSLGATVGAVIALPVIVSVTTHLPWRSIFLLDGLAGLVWLLLWWGCMRRSAERRLQPKPRTPDQSSSESATSVTRMVAILSLPTPWKLLIARGMTDPVWYFYLFWFPKYLASERHLPLAQVARLGWIVYLAAGVGTVLGGVLPRLFWSSPLASKPREVTASYLRAMLLCAAIVPLSPLAVFTTHISVAIALAALIALAHMAWLISLTSLVVEIFPQSTVATAAGLIAAGSAIGGMLSSELIGHLIQSHGYTFLFIGMGFLHPAAIALLWSIGRRQAPPTAVTIPASGTTPEIISTHAD